jgi:TonB family protein
MKLHNYFRLLALVLITSIPAAAQTHPGLFDGSDQPSKVSIDEAEKHLIERKQPTYPPLAKLAKIEGDVLLTLQIDPNGAVIRVIQSSGHPMLIQAATEAAKQYRYRPFIVNGAPAGVFVEAVISFSLYVPIPSVPFPEVTDINSVVFEYDNGSFKLRVSGSGTVEYDGMYRVAVEGKHERHIDPTEVQRLLEAFRGADFFSLRDDYVVGATDVGRTTTSIQVGTLRKVITDDWVQVPLALKGARDAIQKYSHSDQWVKGNSETVSSLLAETPNPVERRKILSEVLPRAVLYGDTTVVLNILANSVDLEHRGPYGATAIMFAADHGIPDMVAALLKAGANPHAVDKSGRGALIFGAGSGNAKVVQLLLDAGVKAGEKDKYGDTALMAAAASGNPECVRLLLERKARVNARNKRRQTALLSGATGDSGFAVDDAFRDHAEVPEEIIHRNVVVKLLVDAGADMNARGWDGETALFSLEDDAVEELIDNHINLEVRDNYGQTALIETVSGSIAELLIKAGANLNAQDNNGKTALIMAADNNEVEKLKVLVNAPGINLAYRDNKGETALMKARAAHHEDCVRLLLSAGTTN